MALDKNFSYVATDGAQGSVGMYIGYNIKASNELMEKIAEDYNALGKYIPEEWEPVKNILRAEWVGFDEQSFEYRFVNKLCDLNNQAFDLVIKCIEAIVKLQQEWVKFQIQNTSGDFFAPLSASTQKFDFSSVMKKDYLLETMLKLNLSREEKIIKWSGRSDLAENTSMGLVHSGSRVKIETAINDFVKGVQGRSNQLFSSITAKNSFFGDQQTGIDSFIEKTGSAIGEVLTAIKDLKDYMEKATKSYETRSSEVSQTFGAKVNEVESLVNDEFGSSRWISND